MSTEATSWRPVVPGYEISGEIGRGGFATVFEAIQSSVERPVALKVISLAGLGSDAERRFRAECRAVGQLSWHPHVVALYDAGFSTEGNPFLAMELLPGGSLGRELADTGPLPAEAVVRVGLQVADALEAAHEAGILHRDLKPDNLMRGKRGEVLLADFGIATLADGTRSVSGSFVGTVAYAAPELLRGGRASEASDQYSLGATLYALLSGRAAFSSETDQTPAAVVWRVMSEPAPPLPPTVPAPLAAVIDRATAKDADDRYPSLAEMVAALDALTGSGAVPPPPVVIPESFGETTVVGIPPAPPPGRPPSAASPDAAETMVVASADPTSTATAGSRPGDDLTSAAPRSRRGIALVGVIIAVLVVAAAAVLLTRSEEESAAPSTSAAPTTAPGPVVMPATAVEVGEDPTALLAAEGAIWTADRTAGTVSRIDPASGAVQATISVPPRPSALAWGEGAIWVVSRPEASVSRIDPETDAVTATFEVGTTPAAVAAGAGSVWVSDRADGTLWRLDPATGEVQARISIAGQPPDGGDALEPLPIAFVDGSVWMADASADEVARVDPLVDRVTDVVGTGARASEIIGSDGKVYVSSPSDGTISVIDVGRGAVVRTFETTSPTDIAVLGEELFSIDARSGAIEVVDLATGEIAEVADVSPDEADPDDIPVTGPPTSVTAVPGSLWLGITGTSAVLRFELSS